MVVPQKIQTLIKHSISSHTELQSFITELQLSILASLELDFQSFTYRLCDWYFTVHDLRDKPG